MSAIIQVFSGMDTIFLRFMQFISFEIANTALYNIVFTTTRQETPTAVVTTEQTTTQPTTTPTVEATTSVEPTTTLINTTPGL